MTKLPDAANVDHKQLRWAVDDLKWEVRVSTWMMQCGTSTSEVPRVSQVAGGVSRGPHRVIFGCVGAAVDGQGVTWHKGSTDVLMGSKLLVHVA